MEQLVKDEAAIPSEQYHLSGICSGFYNWVEAPILGGGGVIFWCYLWGGERVGTCSLVMINDKGVK